MQKKIPFVLTGLTVVAGFGLQFSEYSQWAIMAWLAAALFCAVGLSLRNLRLGVASAAAICAGASAYLLNLKINPSGDATLCTINETIDCVSINDSDLAILFDGTGLEVPITLLGLAFFLPLILAGLIGERSAPRFFQVSAVFGIFNLLVSLYLLSALVSEQTFCVFCVSIYLGNLIILITSFVGMKRSGLTLLGGVQQAATSLSMGIITSGFVVLTSAFFVYKAVTPSDRVVIEADTPVEQIDTQRLATLYQAVPSKGLKLDGTEPITGAKDPTYTLVEFAAYECPHCADASRELKRILKQTDDIQLKFKVFPLTKDCNPALRDSNREGLGPCLAAAAAECGYQQGAFWEINSDLFTNQRALSKSAWNLNDLEFLAKTHNLDMEAFTACIKNPSTMEGVVADAISGADAGIHGTPAFFLKGVTGDDWVMMKPSKGVEDVLTLINAHRKGASLPSPSQ